MRLLIECAVVCCVALIAIAAALWWSLQRAPADNVAGKSTGKPAFADVMRRAKNAPHPRLDLAAGVVASPQSLQVARRRSLDREITQTTSVSAARAAAYAQRPDRAFFREDMGDLSDPDLNKPPADSIRRRTGRESQ